MSRALPYGFGLATAAALIVLWRSKLATEAILTLMSRGEPRAYRHRFRWPYRFRNTH